MKSLTLPLLLGASFVTALSSCNSSQKETAKEQAETPVLRFSAIPDEQTTAQTARYQPVADYLSKKLSVQVEFVPSPDYGASVQKFEGGDIQLAWFGGVTGVQARKAVAGSEAIVAGEEDLAFKSYFIAHSSTGLTRTESFPTAIKDLKFTYGSQSSTSGCIMPTHFLMQATGETPQQFFTHAFNFSESHDKTLELVNNGTFQAGVLNYATYDSAVASGKIDPAQCVIVWETPTYADYNMTAHPVLKKQFGDDFIAKLQSALTECEDPAVLSAFSRKKLVKVNNATFEGIEAVMEKVDFTK